MENSQLIKDLYVFQKRKEILEKERELSEIITEKLCIFRDSIHFDNEEDKMKRLWELGEIEEEKRNEIDKLAKNLEEEIKNEDRK